MSRSFWQILEATVRADILKEMKVQAEHRNQSFELSQPFVQTHLEVELFTTQKSYRVHAQQQYKHYSRGKTDQSNSKEADPQPSTRPTLTTEQWLALRLLNQHGAKLSWPCTPKQLSRVWKKLAFQSHPDRQTTQLTLDIKMTSETFLLLKNAVDVLRLALKQK